MKRTRRTERLNGLLLQEISGTVLREVNDPRVRTVTFTAVDVTPDLRLARVYFSVLDPERQQHDASRGLDSAKGLIKRSLAPRLNLRYMPDLEFIYDVSIERAERIEKILRAVGDSAPPIRVEGEGQDPRGRSDAGGEPDAEAAFGDPHGRPPTG